MSNTNAWDSEKFPIIAGEAALKAQRDQQAKLMEQGFSLPEAQLRSQHIYGAELVRSLYGWTVRYDSGLQGWAILRRATSMASTRLGTLEGEMESFIDAHRFVVEWVERDLGKRYAWVRRQSLVAYGLGCYPW